MQNLCTGKKHFYILVVVIDGPKSVIATRKKIVTDIHNVSVNC